MFRNEHLYYKKCAEIHNYHFQENINRQKPTTPAKYVKQIEDT